MNHIAQFLLCIFLLLGGAAALVYMRYNRLQTESQILQALVPNVLDGLETIEMFGIIDDREFYTQAGCYAGTKARTHNAVAYVRLCQVLKDQGKILPADVAYIVSRCTTIVFLAAISPLESITRYLAIRSLPHLCARGVVDVYTELEARVQNLLGDSPETLNQLRAIV